MTPSRATLFTGLVLAVVSYVTWPDDGQIDLASCAPDGLIARISASLHGSRFWHRQLADAQDRLKRADDWDRRVAEQNAKIDAIMAQVSKTLEESYVRYPSTAPSPAARRAAELREQADDIERVEAERLDSEWMHRHDTALRACEMAIQKQLAATQVSIGDTGSR